MRILHVSDAYLPKQGGIEVQVHDLATRQAQAGHHVQVLTCAPGDDRAGDDRAGRSGDGGDAGDDPDAGDAGDGGDAADDAAFVPVGVHRVAIPWRNVPASNAAMYALLREQRPDVVHAHLSVLSPLSILAVRAAARDGVPVVMTLHSLWWYATPLYAIAHWLLRWGRWRVHWTAVSELAAAPLRAIVGRRTEVTILPNGVEPLAWATEPPDAAIAPGACGPREVVVVSVMRLAPRKRPRALLRVVRSAVRALPSDVRLRVVLVGDGPQRRRLASRIERMGLGAHVELRGRLDRDGIRELFRRADVYVAPAILESFGIAALEARCAGLPVVARRQTGIADFIESGVHGLLADDDRGLSDALQRLAADPALRARMAAHNRACAPETGWADVLQRCELAYKVAAELPHP
jgi:glycosyltransferase involved in cell wall biosynthesis